MKLTFDGIGLNEATDEYNYHVATLAPHYCESGETIARAVTACHGLDLPADVPPGAVAALVDAARKLAATVEGFGVKAPVPIQVEARALSAALAPFTGNPAPVSPESEPAPECRPMDLRGTRGQG
jgi:hypothetical protein